MTVIDPLSDRDVLALGKFIIGCVRERQSRYWRQRLAACARRKAFGPFVDPRVSKDLQDLFARHPNGWVCGLNTSRVLEAANEVAREWGEPPLELVAPPPTPAPYASG